MKVSTKLVQVWKGVGGKQATLLVCSHANGFCKELWLPVLAELEKQPLSVGLDALCIDLPSHGESDKFEAPLQTRVLGEAINVAVTAHLTQYPQKYETLVGVGHSIGGTSLVQAELLNPGLFQSLFLIEPILIPPNKESGLYERSDHNPLALQTLKRKSTFASREAAFQNWQGKGAFKHWKPEILELFCQYGLKETSSGFQLKCSPESEAEIYRMATPIHGELERIHCPTSILNVAASRGHVPAEHALGLFRTLGNPRALNMLPNCTHFMPMEIPDIVALYIQQHLVQDVSSQNRCKL